MNGANGQIQHGVFLCSNNPDKYQQALWEKGIIASAQVKCYILFFILVHCVLISINNHPLLYLKKTAAAILRMHSILSHLPHKHGMKYFNIIVLLHTLTTLTLWAERERRIILSHSFYCI